MVSAIRYSPEQKLAVSIPEWIRSNNNLISRELVGSVAKETDKAILFKGTVSIRPSDNCHRCGKEIDNPVSRMLGYGPICCGYIGLDRPILTKEEMTAFILSIATTLPNYEIWLPKSKITVRTADASDTVQTVTVDIPKPKDVVFSYARGVVEVRIIFALKDYAKASGARWDADNKVWFLEASSGACRRLWETIQQNGFTVEDKDGVWSKITKSFVSLASDLKDAEDLPNIPRLNKSAWRHQRQAYHFIKSVWGDPNA